jgi:hypothetical protein
VNRRARVGASASAAGAAVPLIRLFSPLKARWA